MWEDVLQMTSVAMDFAFWPLMILGPALWLTLLRTPPGVAVDERQLRRLTAWVWICTALASALYVVLHFLWPNFPRPMMLGAVAPAFSLTMRAIPLKNPDWGGHNPQSAARSASLVRRSGSSPIGRWHWTLAFGLSIGLLLAVLARVLWPFAETAESNEWIVWGSALLTVSFGPGMVALTLWAVRRTREESEPRDPAAGPELAENYARLRDFRARCFYWLFGIVMPGVMGSLAVAMAWAPLNRNLGGWLGMAGGVGGTLMGFAGAVFGTVASLRRVRINRELREIQQQHNAPGPA